VVDVTFAGSLLSSGMKLSDDVPTQCDRRDQAADWNPLVLHHGLRLQQARPGRRVARASLSLTRRFAMPRRLSAAPAQVPQASSLQTRCPVDPARDCSGLRAVIPDGADESRQAESGQRSSAASSSSQSIRCRRVRNQVGRPVSRPPRCQRARRPPPRPRCALRPGSLDADRPPGLSSICAASTGTRPYFSVTSSLAGQVFAKW
jgi:hypothetical protein